MKNQERKDAAQAVANTYAPKPEDGHLMYAAVGIMLAGLFALILSGFYNIDLSSHPILIAAVAVFAGVGALILRIVRKRRHTKAHKAEYDKATSDAR